MQIHLNGKQLKTSCTTLKQLIAEQGMASGSLIAEVNFEIIREEKWHITPIKEGDSIELLQFVGGG